MNKLVQQQLVPKVKVWIAIVFQLILTVLFGLTTFAADTTPSPDGGKDNGWGTGNNTGLTQRDWGWYSICQGYRMYFEDENGQVCSPAIDILWSDPDNLAEMGLQSEEVYIEIKNIETQIQEVSSALSLDDTSFTLYKQLSLIDIHKHHQKCNKHNQPYPNHHQPYNKKSHRHKQ